MKTESSPCTKHKSSPSSFLFQLAWLARMQPRVREFAGSMPGSATLFHKLSVTGERMSAEYWLTASV